MSGVPENFLWAVIPLTAFLLTFIWAVTLTIVYHRRHHAREEMEATMKMEMIERGMSAAEIERVLKTRGT